MSAASARAGIVLSLLRRKHSLGGVGVAAPALIAVRGTADPITEIALMLDTALDLLDAQLTATGRFDEYVAALETERVFSELVGGITKPDGDRRHG